MLDIQVFVVEEDCPSEFSLSSLEACSESIANCAWNWRLGDILWELDVLREGLDHFGSTEEDVVLMLVLNIKEVRFRVETVDGVLDLGDGLTG